MRDMNIAKLTSVDVPLFNAIVQDLFPNVELPTIDYGKVLALAPPADLTCALVDVALGFRASSCCPRAVAVCGSAALSGPPCLQNDLELFRHSTLWPRPPPPAWLAPASLVPSEPFLPFLYPPAPAAVSEQWHRRGGQEDSRKF